MDIYENLKKDHDEIISLLDELLTLDREDDYSEVVIKQIEKNLIPHSRAEEAVFYNSIRAVSDNKDVMHSFKEHMEAEMLLRNLQMKEKTDMDWKETAKKLKKALEHHIEEEEGKIFSEAKRIFNEQEATMMSKAFQELKDKTEDEGAMKTSIDMVVNLMPPRFVDKLRNLGT